MGSQQLCAKGAGGWSRGLIRAWWEVSVVASDMVLDPLAPSDLDEDLKGKPANSLY